MVPADLLSMHMGQVLSKPEFVSAGHSYCVGLRHSNDLTVELITLGHSE